jgi:hypothetical protein
MKTIETKTGHIIDIQAAPHNSAELYIVIDGEIFTLTASDALRVAAALTNVAHSVEHEGEPA